MVTKSKSRKSFSAKKRFIGKPTGQIQDRVQTVGPEHFGIVSVDCAKRRSKWMFCDFYGRVLIEPTPVEHTRGALSAMTALINDAAAAEAITDCIVAVEPLQKLAAKKQRGVKPIGDLLIPLLARLGVGTAQGVESNMSEARGSD